MSQPQRVQLLRPKFRLPRDIDKARFEDSSRRAEVSEDLTALEEIPAADSLVDIDIVAKRLKVSPDRITSTLKAIGAVSMKPEKDTAMIRTCGANSDGKVFSLPTIIALNDSVHLSQ